MFEVITKSGEVLASRIPDANSARLFAAAPRILEALNSTNWVVGNYAEALVRDAKKEGRINDCDIERALASKEDADIALVPSELQEGGVELDPALCLLLNSLAWRETEELAYAHDGLFPVR